MIKIIFLLLFIPLQLISQEPLNNILIYGEGDIQVTSEVNEYNPIAADVLIQGTIMITHPTANSIDVNSFRMGDKPLTVKFVQSVPMSSYSNVIVTIYQFQLDGLKKGVHTLPPIRVKVGGKDYQAAPLTIEVAPSNP